MTEDYSETYSFEDAVNRIAYQSIVNGLPMPSWIRDNTPGHGLLVLSWTTPEAMRQWFGYFNVRQHRAYPPVWAWGWHGWTVELTVLDSGADALSEARSSVPGTVAEREQLSAKCAANQDEIAKAKAINAGRSIASSRAALERGAAVASALLDPDATIVLPCGQATRREPHGSHIRHEGAYSRHCGGWADAPTEPQPAVNLWNHPQTGEVVVSQFPSVTA